MPISKLLPTLDNAGRRLVLAEIVGEPVSVKLARRRHEKLMKTRTSTSVSAQDTISNKSTAVIESKAITDVTKPKAQPLKSESSHEAKFDHKVSLETINEASTRFELKEKTEIMTVETVKTALELNTAPEVNSVQSLNTQPSSSPPLPKVSIEEDSTLNKLVKELGEEGE